ncbi:hypothetical protein PG997_010630 [Apiospora hydei]|uniref:Alpha/beta hydrolase fold-3 domain-containing protein n=1 Tax=Apiospora hydei TaxID=1337664 RepID=A0ABR1VGT8_9PEZI
MAKQTNLATAAEPRLSLPWLARQPVSSVYNVCYLATLVLVRVPYWILNLRQSLMVTLIKASIHGASVLEKPTPLSLEPGKEKEQFLVAQPGSEADYVGPLRSDAVAPAPVGITCFTRKPETTDKQKSPASSVSSSESQPSMVMLHVHGGAFVIGDGRIDQMGYGASMLLRHAGVRRVYSVQYRLACRPDSVPFPGALQDVLTSYLYLVRELGIPAENVVVSGDSAGGNLVIGLLRYLADAVLFSPWVAPAQCLGPDDLVVTSNPHYGTDILAPAFLRWGAAAYSRLVPASDSYISPLGHPFVTAVLEVEGMRWVREMREVTAAGGKRNDVELNYEEGAPHDTLLVGNNLGWDESVREVTGKVGEFIRRKTPGSG